MTESPFPDDLPEFTPVPSASTRHDRWTPERQRRFIAVLALDGTVAAAARAVGKSATTAYRLRERAGAEDFARAWDIARSMGQDRVFAAAIDRALNGIEVPRYYAGRRIGTTRRPDYRTMEAMLRQMPLAGEAPLGPLLDGLAADPGRRKPNATLSTP